MCPEDYSVTELARALSTLGPCSIAVYQETRPLSYRWEFSYLSALHVTVVLSRSQSLQMETGIASTSVRATRPPIGLGTQLRFYGIAE